MRTSYSGVGPGSYLECREVRTIDLRDGKKVAMRIWLFQVGAGFSPNQLQYLGLWVEPKPAFLKYFR
ncbi:MAG: hypothetical protein ABEK29_00195, partial [Bradymonadaceae bacterium]